MEELCADLCTAYSLVVSLRKGFGELSPELRNLLTWLRAKELDMREKV